MALTKHFKQTVVQRAKCDPEFRRAMFIDAINELFSGDVDVAKAMLRDYINATITFQPLAEEVDKNSKSLQRMFSAKGNPTTKSLFEIVRILQEKEGISLSVKGDDKP